MAAVMRHARRDVFVTSAGDRLAAWLYRPSPAPRRAGPCIVMAHGFSLTRHDGLDAYAARFAAHGLRVLVFDYRFLGDSGGQPRQRLRERAQLEDWRSAVAYARRIPDVDADQLVLWGYSLSGGRVVRIAASDRRVAAAMVLAPFVDGLPGMLAMGLVQAAWLLPRALAELAGRPVRIPVTGPPGSRAALTSPGEAEGYARLVAAGSPWRNEIGPAVFATMPFYRPVSHAARISCPLWVGLGERDESVPGDAVVRLAERAPCGELQRYPYDHFEPFTDGGVERVFADQMSFLARQGLADGERQDGLG